jgi:hypothetical protein
VPVRLRIFTVGFTIGLLLFWLANFVSYNRMIREPVLTDATIGFGFPCRLYMSGGFTGESILWGGLIVDVLVATCCSVILGLVAGVVFKKRVSR